MLKSINVRKRSGPDGNPPLVLNEYAPELAPINPCSTLFYALTLKLFPRAKTSVSSCSPEER